MKFDPGIESGDILSHVEMYKLFQCGSMQGIRPSKKTSTIVVVSDHTKGFYQDIWKNGVLHYTGMGKIGNQTLTGRGIHNHLLYNLNENEYDVHLFEVIEKAKYIYRGVVKLADEPYKTIQKDINGNDREVWIFPLEPIENIDDILEREQLEKELIKLSDEELVRRIKVKNVGKKTHTTETTIHYRDPSLKQMVKRIAEGKCQYCGSEAPFKDKNNEPYLEEHHVKALAEGGTDTIDNVVAICPNCHRKMHVLNDMKDVIILEKVAKDNEKVMARILAYAKGMSDEENS